MPDPVGGILQRSDIIALCSYWKQKRFDYDGSGNVEYIGFHYVPQAPVTDDKWEIWKLTYTGSDITLIEGPKTGDWDSNDSLDWL